MHLQANTARRCREAAFGTHRGLAPAVTECVSDVQTHYVALREQPVNQCRCANSSKFNPLHERASLAPHLFGLVLKDRVACPSTLAAFLNHLNKVDIARTTVASLQSTNTAGALSVYGPRSYWPPSLEAQAGPWHSEYSRPYN